MNGKTETDAPIEAQIQAPNLIFDGSECASADYQFTINSEAIAHSISLKGNTGKTLSAKAVSDAFFEEMEQRSIEIAREAQIITERKRIRAQKRRKRQVKHNEFTRMEALIRASPSNTQRYQVFLSPEIGYSDRLKLTAVNPRHIRGALIDLEFEQLTNETWISPKTGEVVVLHNERSMYNVEPATAKSMLRIAYAEAKNYDRPFERRDFSLDALLDTFEGGMIERRVEIFGDDFYNPEYELDMAPSIWGFLDMFLNAERIELDMRIVPDHWHNVEWWNSAMSTWEEERRLEELILRAKRAEQDEEAREHRAEVRATNGQTTKRTSTKGKTALKQAALSDLRAMLSGNAESSE